MTILHAFSKAANDIAACMNKYFVTRDPKELAEATTLLQAQVVAVQGEIQDPSIQETSVQLTNLDTVALGEQIQAANSVTLENPDYVADGPIEKGKLIRVHATEQEEGSTFLMKVTYINDSVLIMAPVLADLT